MLKTEGRLPAPIAIFVYNREQHAGSLLRSLDACDLFHESQVTIFCDGPRNSLEEIAVSSTRRLVKSMAPRARIVERDRNMGCANSIIAGVTELCEEYGRAIAIEDDLVFSPFALQYFNDALDVFEHEDRVMHVSGYMFPVRKRVPEAFFFREVTPWGWATWRRAWRHFEPDTRKSIDWIAANHKIREFDMYGSAYFWQMLHDQLNGVIDAWDIRWYASLFMRGGLSLHPGTALVANKGFDGTGVHCTPTSDLDVVLAQKPLAPSSFPTEIAESRAAVRAMVDFRKRMRPSLAARVKRRIRLVAERFGALGHDRHVTS